jgi:hypothetical protein
VKNAVFIFLALFCAVNVLIGAYEWMDHYGAPLWVKIVLSPLAWWSAALTLKGVYAQGEKELMGESE